MNTNTSPANLTPNTITQAPEGYMQDHKGHLIPVSQIKEIDLIRDDLVKRLVDEALATQKVLKNFKLNAFSEIADFIEMSADRYDVQVGGKKGNATFYSFDGKYKIQRAVNENMAFDEGILAAKALIQECLDDWTQDANGNLKALVSRAFEVDKEGNLSTNRILGLRRVKIDDTRWQQAMDAISDSLQVIDSKSYIRIYQRENNGKYTPISMDLASL